MLKPHRTLPSKDFEKIINLVEMRFHPYSVFEEYAKLFSTVVTVPGTLQVR
jgi:hypothetical protein